MYRYTPDGMEFKQTHFSYKLIVKAIGKFLPFFIQSAYAMYLYVMTSTFVKPFSLVKSVFQYSINWNVNGWFISVNFDILIWKYSCFNETFMSFNNLLICFTAQNLRGTYGLSIRELIIDGRRYWKTKLLVQWHLINILKWPWISNDNSP